MAKLSARGRAEVFRVMKKLPDDGLSTDRVERYVLMSDRVILRNLVVRFRPAHDLPASLHNHGWRQHGVAKPGLARDLLHRLLHAGFVQEGVADFTLILGEEDATIERRAVQKHEAS